MRAAVLRNGRMVLRDDVPEPQPGPGQVLVEVKACGICGSDLHFAKHGDEMIRLTREMKGMPVEGGLSVDLAADVFMGHEFSAELSEASPDTEAPRPGTIVTSLPVLLSAKDIEPIIYSNTTIGGYAERMLLSAPLLLQVPNGLDPRHAALTEPMAVGLHAVNMSKIERGETALVLGCGPIGIAIIAALANRGVETIVASDYSVKRRELAEAMGAHHTVDPAGGSPFDTTTPAVIFEAVGVPGILDDVLRRAPIGSRIVVAGVCMQPDSVLRLCQTAQPEICDGLRTHGVRGIAAGHRRGRDRRRTDDHRRGGSRRDRCGVRRSARSDPDRHCKILATPQR
jgi:threonine dehydrogenase-like Zn-dependent dehydrogenase